MLKLFLIFARLGTIGFGGPIALITLIEQVVCKEQKWLNEAEFAEIFSICKLMPGPIAVQVSMCVGYRRHGRLGGLIAGLGFTLPAVLLMLVLSILYVRNGSSEGKYTLYLFKFMQDATISVIILAVIDMSKGYINTWKMVCLTVIGGIIIYNLPSYEPLIIIAFGLLGVTTTSHKVSNKMPIIVASSVPFSIWHGLVTARTTSILGQLLWTFLKAGEFSFGTGLAIIPLLHSSLVSTHHWLTDRQFLDGVSLGQITPGPTTVSVVFFGYKIAGIMGVIIALVGFYVPACFNTLVLMPLLWQKLTRTKNLQVFLRFAFPAIIGGIISASLKLGMVTVTRWYDWLIIILTFVIIKKKILPIWAVIPLCGITGVAVGVIRLIY